MTQRYTKSSNQIFLRRPLGEAGRPGLNTSLPVSSSGLGTVASKPGIAKLNSSVSVNSPRSGPGQVPSGPAGPVQPLSSRGQPPPLGAPGGQQRQPPTLAGAGGRSLPGPPLPRPILPRERGYLDKFVEFLVSEGFRMNKQSLTLKTSGGRWSSQ